MLVAISMRSITAPRRKSITVPLVLIAALFAAVLSSCDQSPLSKDTIRKSLMERAERNKQPLMIDSISDVQTMTLHGEKCSTAMAYVKGPLGLSMPIYFVCKQGRQDYISGGGDLINIGRSCWNGGCLCFACRRRCRCWRRIIGILFWQLSKNGVVTFLIYLFESQASASPSPLNNSTPSPQRQASEFTSSRALDGEQYPQTRLRVLTAEDVKGLNIAQLRYAINEVYARYGATFPNTPDIQRHFDRFSWYHPNPSLTYEAIDQIMTDVERQNVKFLVLSRELKRGR
jgi:hypothetical protein